MDVTDVRQALADVLSTTGLRTYQYVPEAINPPCAIVEFPELIDFNQAMGKGLDSFEIPILVLTQSASDRAGQKELEKYASGSGSYSIREAIWNNKTLNGACSSAHVHTINDFGNRMYGTGNYLQFRALITVIGTS